MMWWPYGAQMGWWWIVGGLWMVIFWGGLIALIVWGIKKLTERGGSGSSTTGQHDPLNTVKERYVKGDISREEFQQIRKDLS